MRVLVLGAAGQLGAELASQAREQGHDVVALTRADLDITDPLGVRQRLLEGNAEVVFNAAAYTAVDRAESQPELAMAINGLAPGVIATAAREAGSRLVHFSTDYVFDGTATSPIPEDAAPNPVSVYGRTKLAGEEAVWGAGGESIVVRTAWVYGLQGTNFVRTVLRVTSETGEMRVVDDQLGSPSWARDVAAASLHLAEVGTPGTYHLTNAGACSWYELACAIVEFAGVRAEIHPIPTSEYPTSARRPAYAVLDNLRWRQLGETPLRSWREALGQFLGKLE